MFEGPNHAPTDDHSEDTPVTNDPKLAEKFPQPTAERKFTIDGNGMVHFVENEQEAGELHHKMHEDA